jgi:hypothetical protein
MNDLRVGTMPGTDVIDKELGRTGVIMLNNV